MPHLTESTLEETALEWLRDLGYTIVYGNIVPENKLTRLWDGMLVRDEVRVKDAED